MDSKEKSIQFIFIRSLPAILFLSLIFIYLPGLSGPFLFDDFANLNKLGRYGKIDNWQTLQAYLFGGISGPSGRPISLLSFLVNANDWPAEPGTFKITNLILHLTTALLLYFINFKILKFLGINKSKAILIASIATSFWALNPFFVSTVLYVVQRMTILAALFVALGLLMYIHGREKLDHDPQKGYLWMSLAIIGCTPLAYFSKENGALLPLLVLLVELIVLRHATKRALVSKKWLEMFLILPILLIVGYFIITWQTWLGHYNGRPFTLEERLLTETRILFNYLFQLIIPSLNSGSLFYENYTLSKGFFHPISTLFSIIALISMIFCAFLYQRRWPLFSLAILFFLAGHIVESTFLPLELYFEHRNYLPAFFLFLPIADLIVNKAKDFRFIPVTLMVFMFFHSFVTYQQATLWGDKTLLIMQWAAQNPTSMRAQRSVAIEWEHQGRPDLALRQLHEAERHIPDSVELLLHRLTLQCRYTEVKPQEILDAESLIRRVPYHFRVFNLSEALINEVISGRCKGIDLVAAHQLLTALANNPTALDSTGPLSQINYLRGTLYIHENKPELALLAFQEAFLAHLDHNVGMMAVATLATHKMFDEALALLHEVRMSIEGRSSKLGELDLHQEIARVKANILQEQAKISTQ